MLFNKVFFNLFNKHLFAYPDLRLAVTYKCSNACPYCSFIDYQKKVPFHMDIADFLKVLNWLKKQKKRSLLLTGGEPFEHPDIAQMISIASRLFPCTSILTNGVCLENYSDLLIHTKNIQLIINVNPDINFGSVSKKARSLKSKVVLLRYNFSTRHSTSEFKRILNLAKQIKVPVRFGFSEPSLFGNNECFNIDQMQSYKNKLFVFLKIAKNLRVHAHFARPVPLCIYTKEERAFLKRNAKLKGYCLLASPKHNYYQRAIVNPDVSVYSCYGGIHKANSLLDFSNLDELGDFFLQKIVTLVDVPLMPICKSCDLRNECQGGCLVRKMV